MCPKFFTRLLAAALLLSTAPAHADLTFVLAPASQSGAVSNEVVFAGTLSNTSLTDNLFLNDLQLAFTGAATNDLSGDTNTFFANVPGILLPGETYSDIVFAVAINAATPPGDYFGSVTLLGGSNIFAATNLATQTFQISSPSVAISATTTDAFKFGAQPGEFTISRLAGTNMDLTVNYVVGGTASNGVDFSLISNSVAIQAGSASATVTIIPIEDNVVDGDTSVVLILSDSIAYNLGAPASATVTIHDSPFNTWRLAEFGTNANTAAISGDFADPDADGIVNLLEYALNLNPNVPSAAGLPTPQIDPSCGCLTLTYTKAIAAIDLAYTPEAADEPGGPWNTDGVTQTVISSDSITQTINASDAGHPIATNSKRFMRLKVTRLP